MYFTKKMQNDIAKKVLSRNYNLYAIKLGTGVYTEDAAELEQLVDLMFAAWRKIVISRSRGYMKNYDGVIKRLFFRYVKEKGGYEPYFYLLCLRKKKELKVDEEYKIRIEEEKLRIQTYIKWFSAWANALKLCTQVSVNFSLVELENLETIIGKFCTNEKYTLQPLIDEAKRELLKKASGNKKHKLVSFHGVFNNRQLSVER